MHDEHRQQNNINNKQLSNQYKNESNDNNDLYRSIIFFIFNYISRQNDVSFLRQNVEFFYQQLFRITIFFNSFSQFKSKFNVEQNRVYSSQYSNVDYRQNQQKLKNIDQNYRNYSNYRSITIQFVND